MKRNKIYELIGRAVVYSSLYVGSVVFFYWGFLQRINILGGKKLENEFEKIELYEKDGIGEIRMNGKKINGLTGYSLKRNTDMIDIVLNISVPKLNFKTIEKQEEIPQHTFPLLNCQEYQHIYKEVQQEVPKEG